MSFSENYCDSLMTVIDNRIDFARDSKYDLMHACRDDLYMPKEILRSKVNKNIAETFKYLYSDSDELECVT